MEINIRFEEALSGMKQGKIYYRNTPKLVGEVIGLKEIGATDNISRPYFYRIELGIALVPYAFTNEDLLANDWCLYSN